MAKEKQEYDGNCWDASAEPVNEDIPANSVGAGNIAGLQGEPPVRNKKRNIMTFNRFMKK